MDSSLINFLDDLCDQTYILEDSILEPLELVEADNFKENVEPITEITRRTKSTLKTEIAKARTKPESKTRPIKPKIKSTTEMSLKSRTKTKFKKARCKPLQPKICKAQKFINPSFIPKNNKWHGTPEMEPSLLKEPPFLELDEVAEVRDHQKVALDLVRLNRPLMGVISRDVCSDLGMMFIRIALDKYVDMSEDYRCWVVSNERMLKGTVNADHDQFSQKRPVWECEGFGVEFE